MKAFAAASSCLLAIGCTLLAGAAQNDGSSVAPATQPASSDVEAFSDEEISRIFQQSPLGPLPRDTNRFADDVRAARLGQFLFFDTRLSGNGAVSCSTCHDPQHSFTDAKALSEGRARGVRHTPSLWNVAYNRWFFWDGRVDSLWSQALKPMEHASELGATRLQIAHLICADASLRQSYEQVFGPLPDLSDSARFPAAGGPIDGNPQAAAWSAMKPEDQMVVNSIFANAGKAIEAYERKLISRRAPFDVFVEGLKSQDQSKLAAMSPAAQRGLKLFVGRGECRLCHSGPNFSDSEFHDVGVPVRGDVPADTGRLTGITLLLSDPFNAAGPFSDERTGAASEQLEFLVSAPQNFGQFKTPSLRNVALTPPYMHQGQFASLDEVIQYYSTLSSSSFAGHHDETILRPREFTPDEAADIRAFLESLTDTGIDPALLTKPDSPFAPGN